VLAVFIEAIRYKKLIIILHLVFENTRVEKNELNENEY
jgi:hypothetical protein